MSSDYHSSWQFRNKYQFNQNVAKLGNGVAYPKKNSLYCLLAVGSVDNPLIRLNTPKIVYPTCAQNFIPIVLAAFKQDRI